MKDIIDRYNSARLEPAPKELLAEAIDEITRLRAENEKLRLELDIQQATILVPSQKDDQRRIERLDAALKEALDEAAQLRKENKQLRDAYDTEALLISYNLGYACGKDITKDIVKDEIERRHAELTKVDMELVADLSAERNRLRDENKKLREELEMMRKACRKACKANYKLGIDKGKEKAIIRMRDMGE